jgi:hypothetical protein
MSFLFRFRFPFARISTSWSLSPLQCWSHKKHRSKGGKATHARLNPQHTHAHKPRRELKTWRREFTMELKSLTQQSKCVEAESRCLKMFREFLVYCSMRLGVPSIAPRLLGAVGDQLGRQILPSVEWCTGQSGAPPDSYNTCSVLDFLLYRTQSTVGPPGPLVHRTLSGVTIRPLAQPCVARWPRADDRWSRVPMTHRTVRCTIGQSGDF